MFDEALMLSSGVVDDHSEAAIVEDLNKIAIENEKAAIEAKKAKAQGKKVGRRVLSCCCLLFAG